MNGFIFDNDGVIIDTERRLVDLNVQVCGELGFIFDPALRSQFAGKPNQEGIFHLLKAHGQEKNVSVQDYMMRRDVLLREWYAAPQFTPGFLSYFHGLLEEFPGVSVGIASGTDEEFFEMEDRYLGVMDLFQGNVALSNRDVRNHKPAPDIFIYAAALIGVSPQECAVWEDSPLGIAAGYRAGVPRIIGYTRTLGAQLKAVAEEALGSDLRGKTGLREGQDIILIDAFDERLALDQTIRYLRR